jgi:two-component system, LytTR family, response regulator
MEERRGAEGPRVDRKSPPFAKGAKDGAPSNSRGGSLAIRTGENKLEGREKIRVMVVDDEPMARSNLKVLLRRDQEVELVSECGSGKEALNAIRNKRPELVFLDVQMPECDGFDVLEQLGAELPPALVFVTAYDEYALKAFEAGALDYLLKPFNDKRFARALTRAKERIAQGKESAGKVERVAVKNAGEVLFVKVADIDWVEAADYYVSLHVGGRAHLLRRSMADVEEELKGAGFCRIHRSAIVNLERVRRLEIGADGGTELVLADKTRVGLSRRHRRELQRRLGIVTRVAPGEE